MEYFDVLAFGAHPDDVEIGMAGTIAKFTKLGYKVAICDLTEAELSSNGDTSTRRKEAEAADKILGVSKRFNLSFSDRGLYLSEDSIKQVVSLIRMTKPSIVFSPYEFDRHPDHGNCTKIIEEAVFSSGIRKLNVNTSHEAHKVNHVFQYMINGFHRPNFIVNISETIQLKKEALEAYESQFTPGETGVSTPLTNDYVESVIAREKMIGKEVGISYGEGFMSKKPLLLNADWLF
ncbi:bacillithiol biosynthesis deacetylase BshB1 [Bacillus sp. EAC]|uniref:bacillithiol biosynthesis deacetylase BshB1 n=1 Tax=Bacillus sp. EAC TaxID=1978338 RepID=UPI0011551418|nr:bacillithiol biosynthesis deacetylase BshB1 [Bacillus sp. EAC]